MPSFLENLADTWPARMGRAAGLAAMLPGDVYGGRVDPLSQEGIGRAQSVNARSHGIIGPIRPDRRQMAL